MNSEPVGLVFMDKLAIFLLSPPLNEPIVIINEPLVKSIPGKQSIFQSSSQCVEPPI